MSYTNKTNKTTIQDTIITTANISPLKKSLTMFQLSKVLLPSLGMLTDGLLMMKDKSMIFSSALNMIASNSTLDEFENLQVLLLGSIVENDEPLTSVENINSWMERNSEINQYDLLMFLLKTHLLQDILESDLFKKNIDKLKAFRTMFADVLPELSEAPSEEVSKEALPEEE